MKAHRGYPNSGDAFEVPPLQGGIGFPSFVERAAFLILFVGFCSLFTGLELRTSFIIIKPFDLVSFLLLPLILLLAVGRGLFPRSFGLTLVILFFIVDVASAKSVSTSNGLREAIQMFELTLFAMVLALYRGSFDWERMAKYFLIVSFFITAFNIWWHVSHGFYFGWKRLNEPKFLFSYSLPVIFSLFLLNRRHAGLLEYLCLVAIGILLVFSGERKAQIGFLVCVLTLALVGYVQFGPLLLGSWLGALSLSTVIASSPYLSSQLHSMSTLSEAASATIGELKTPDPELSLSNAQRAFASRVSADLIDQNPVWGVGTNAYLSYVRSAYSDYPGYLLIEIHNEFQRILVGERSRRLVLLSSPLGKKRGLRRRRICTGWAPCCGYVRYVLYHHSAPVFL